jgi:hypothetical protein
MSLVNLHNRLRKLERQLRPHGDGCFTLEELCRAIWDRNKQSFIELAEGNSYRLFVSRFEAEDAEREAAERKRREEAGLCR